MAHIEHLTVAKYVAFASATGVGVVHFWTEWDMSHLRVRLALDIAVDRVARPVRLGMFDADQVAPSDLLRGLKLATVPTLFYYRDGQRVPLQIGIRSADAIATTLADVLVGGTPGRV